MLFGEEKKKESEMLFQKQTTRSWLLECYLVLVQLTVFVFLLSLGPESDDDKAHKDIHHEEGNDDDVDNEEYGDLYPVIVYWSLVFCIGINSFVQEPGIG